MPNREVDQNVLVLEAQSLPQRPVDQSVLVLEAGEILFPPVYYWAERKLFQLVPVIEALEPQYWGLSQVMPLVEATPYYWWQLAQAMPEVEAHAYYWWLSQVMPVVHAAPAFWQLAQVMPEIEIKLVPPPLIPFPEQVWKDLELEASYSVLVRKADGTQLAIVDDYDKLDYTRKLNDQGYYELTASTDLIDETCLQLDYLVEVLRCPPSLNWRTDFAGLHRFKSFSFDEQDKEWLKSVGPGLESLLRRRIIIPPAGEAFLTVENEFTDIMRQLVRTQAGLLASSERRFQGLNVEADTHEGVELRLNYRYTNLFEELATLAELGADLSVEKTGSAEFEFRVYYPQRGHDRRVGNLEGLAPVQFSLEWANMQRPTVEDSRLEEVTVAYVGGEGVGAEREIVERSSLAEAELDSPWNRIETFLEARREASTAALMAIGDAHLSEKRQSLTFKCEAIPTPVCLYGVHWDLGDLVTGYYKGTQYDMQISEVRVTVDDSGEHIHPTFEVFGYKPTEVGDYVYWA